MNSTANALSYGVSSQPPETQRARICSNSLFFPGEQRICPLEAGSLETACTANLDEFNKIRNLADEFPA